VIQKQRLYWTGNAAKARIVAQILDEAGPKREALIFDYGCGAGGDWPNVLGDYPNLKLAYYDPDSKAMAKAGQRLSGHRTQALTAADLAQGPPLEADFIVSLSVLEHVHDRRGYLKIAARHLSSSGLFFLNYDDGHFRNRLDLNRPWQSSDQIKEWLRNLASRPLVAARSVSRFQRRVCRETWRKMI